MFLSCHFPNFAGRIKVQSCNAYSVRAAQMAVHELLGVDRKVPPITPHDESLRVQFEALIKAFK